MYWWWYSEWYGGRVYDTARRSSGIDDPPGAKPSPGGYVTSGMSTAGVLARRVAQALIDDPAITGGVMEVAVQNGVVILDGDVATEVTRTAVSLRVWSVPGVLDVCNALTVGEHPEQS
jgi:osmotically-inducible protein OsmY